MTEFDQPVDSYHGYPHVKITSLKTTIRQQRKKTVEVFPMTPARPPHPQAIGKLPNQQTIIVNKKPGVDQRNEVRETHIYYDHNDTRLPATAIATSSA